MLETERECKKCHGIFAIDQFRVVKKKPPKKDGVLKTCLRCEAEIRRIEIALRKKIDPVFVLNQREAKKKWGRTPYGREVRNRNARKRTKNPTPTQKAAQIRKNEVKRNRNNTDAVYNFRKRMSERIRKCFRIHGVKQRKSFSSLSYTPESLFNHLNLYLDKKCEECNMNVITVKNSHIDHIIPISSACSVEEVLKLNELNNLRLICPKCNWSKGVKEKPTSVFAEAGF